LTFSGLTVKQKTVQKTKQNHNKKASKQSKQKDRGQTYKEKLRKEKQTCEQDTQVDK